MNICLITRTQPGADASVMALSARGLQALAIPAAEILPMPGELDLRGVQALLMTSAAAARCVTPSPEILDMPVYAVGDMTATSAIENNFTNVVSAGGDGAALAVLAADRLKPSEGALLHVRGKEVAGDVTGMLSACGFETRFQEVYRTIDAPNFRNQIREHVAQQMGAIIIHSPAGGRRVAMALEALESHLNRWSLFGLSQACLGQLGTLPFKTRFYADKPDEKALLDLVAANHSHFGP